METQENMKWFKFMIYFGLFAGAIYNVYVAITQFTGLEYKLADLSPELVYSFFPTLKIIDICYGILALILACFLIFIRFRLARFKENAPRLLYAVYILNFIITLIYCIVASVILQESVFGAFEIVYLIEEVIMLMINFIYFRRRNYLFIN